MDRDISLINDIFESAIYDLTHFFNPYHEIINSRDNNYKLLCLASYEPKTTTDKNI